jgi:hypothetical protein
VPQFGLDHFHQNPSEFSIHLSQNSTLLDSTIGNDIYQTAERSIPFRAEADFVVTNKTGATGIVGFVHRREF